MITRLIEAQRLGQSAAVVRLSEVTISDPDISEVTLSGETPAQQIVLTDIGPRGPSGASGTASSFSYSFTLAASWPIAHNMGRDPIVEVIVNGEKVLADIIFIDENNLVIMFSEPTSGKAILI